MCVCVCVCVVGGRWWWRWWWWWWWWWWERHSHLALRFVGSPSPASAFRSPLSNRQVAVQLSARVANLTPAARCSILAFAKSRFRFGHCTESRRAASRRLAFPTNFRTIFARGELAAVATRSRGNELQNYLIAKSLQKVDTYRQADRRSPLYSQLSIAKFSLLRVAYGRQFTPPAGTLKENLSRPRLGGVKKISQFHRPPYNGPPPYS